MVVALFVGVGAVEVSGFAVADVIKKRAVSIMSVLVRNWCVVFFMISRYIEGILILYSFANRN